MTAPDTLMPDANGRVPNDPALPVLHYRGVVPAGDPDAIEARLRSHGWRPDWAGAGGALPRIWRAAA